MSDDDWLVASAAGHTQAWSSRFVFLRPRALLPTLPPTQPSAGHEHLRHPLPRPPRQSPGQEHQFLHQRLHAPALAVVVQVYQFHRRHQVVGQRGDPIIDLVGPQRLERSHFSGSAGFRACGCGRLSSRPVPTLATRDRNVPRTRRQECLRYVIVGNALTRTPKSKNCGWSACSKIP